MKPSKWLTLKETKNDGHKSLQIYILAVKQASESFMNEVEDKKPDMYPICQMNPLSFQIC